MKNSLMTASAALALAAGVLTAGYLIAEPGLAGASDYEESCGRTSGEQQPMEALLEKLRAEGWQRIEEVELEEGCYEVEGLGPDGRETELYIDAVTLDLVKQD